MHKALCDQFGSGSVALTAFYVVPGTLSAFQYYLLSQFYPASENLGTILLTSCLATIAGGVAGAGNASRSERIAQKRAKEAGWGAKRSSWHIQKSQILGYFQCMGAALAFNASVAAIALEIEEPNFDLPQYTAQENTSFPEAS